MIRSFGVILKKIFTPIILQINSDQYIKIFYQCFSSSAVLIEFTFKVIGLLLQRIPDLRIENFLYTIRIFFFQ